MPDFLATVTDRSGKRETQTVHTDNSQQAVEFLQSHGCTAIVLHTDDTAAAAEAPLARMYPELTSQSSPQHRLEARGLTDLQFLLFTARVFYSKTPWMTIGLVAMLVINAVTGLHNALIYAFAGLGLLLPVFFAVLITLFGVARKYNRLAEALAWGRWQEVVDRSNRLKGRIPDSELARMRALRLLEWGNWMRPERSGRSSKTAPTSRAGCTLRSLPTFFHMEDNTKNLWNARHRRSSKTRAIPR